MGAVRAKMYIESVGHTKWGTTAKFRVVTRGEDNKAWSAATPTGSLELGIANAIAAAQFAVADVEAGREYFVTIEPVGDELQGEEGGTWADVPTE